MIAADMTPLLERWAQLHQELTEADEAMEALTGRSPESPLFGAMWGAFGAYTEMLETVLIGSAASRWLEWFQFECRMGEQSMTVVLQPGDEERPIRTLDDLAALLETCQ